MIARITPDRRAEGERVIADLLSYMSPLEKAGQLAIRRLPDPQDRLASDEFRRALREGRIGAVSGIAHHSAADGLQQIAVEQSRLGIPLLFTVETGTGVDTILPAPLAAAASWDLDAIERAEAAVAAEAVIEGFNWTLSPHVELLRPGTARPGGTSGEQLVLARQIAAARLRGLDGDAEPAGHNILATLDLSPLFTRHPHSLAHAAELARTAVRSAGFGALANRDALEGNGALLAAFSFLGETDGFSGIDLAEWRRLALDVHAELGPHFEDMPVDAIARAVESGEIAEARLDEAVSRVLRMKYRLGLFSEEYEDERSEPRNREWSAGDRRHAAHALALRCPVLLRNDPALLPITPDSGELLVVGTAATDRQLPLDGREATGASLIDGLERLGMPHKYVPGLALRGGMTPTSTMIEADKMAIGMAREAARRAGTVLVVFDDSARLGEASRQLLSALSSANPRVILVTLGHLPVHPQINGRHLPSILHAGRLGTMGGHALAELIAGTASPSGKLPLTVRSDDGLHGLPFGHGLTYADIGLTGFALDLERDCIRATVELSNSDEREGIETLQLYVRPIKGDDIDETFVLRDFRRVVMLAGERRKLEFEIGAEQIGRLGADGRLGIDHGMYDIRVGLSVSSTIGGEIMLPSAVARAMLLREQTGRAAEARRRA